MGKFNKSRKQTRLIKSQSKFNSQLDSNNSASDKDRDDVNIQNLKLWRMNCITVIHFLGGF